MSGREGDGVLSGMVVLAGMSVIIMISTEFLTIFVFLIHFHCLLICAFHVVEIQLDFDLDTQLWRSAR